MQNSMRYCPQCRSDLVPSLEGGAERLVCSHPDCSFVHWNNPVPVVAAIVEHEGAVILARNAQWPEGRFGLITGFLEAHDESPESGILREVEEELGLQGRIESHVGNYPFQRMNQVILAYHVAAEGILSLGEELAEVRRVAPARLRPWQFGTGLAIRDWLERRLALEGLL